MRKTKKANKKNDKLSFFDVVRILIIALVIAYFITHYIVSSTQVEGTSMENTLNNADRIFIQKAGVSEKTLKRGDIIVFQAPDENLDYIKRVIAFPNEYVQIENGQVYINGTRLNEPYINTDYTHTSDQTEWLVGEGEIFVMGDNRIPGASKDSRSFGPIPVKSILGRAFFRYFPLDSIGGLH